jgi:hypothetical protein
MDKKSDVLAMKTESQNWLRDNFHEEWVTAYRHYKCERPPELDPVTGKPDPEVTSLSMPDTWAVVRKKAARITANIPNLRVRAADKARAQRIGWKLMRDWDRGGVQRVQARHVTQGLIFGWSVRPWTWAIEEMVRTKKVDPMDPRPEIQELLLENYGDKLPPELMPMQGDDPEIEQQKGMQRTTLLLQQFGQGRKPPLIPVKYRYKPYEGPKTDFLFIGDCFPEPGFQTLRSSKWFIVQRFRDQAWMKRVSERYKNLKAGFDALMSEEPNGSNRVAARAGDNDLRTRLESETGRNADHESHGSWEAEGDIRKWLVLECHYSGQNSRIVYASHKGRHIGEIPYPYELDGRIAFTELTLIDDILGGIGDSDARIIRGLQQIHDRSVCTRVDLVDTIQRPYVWTTNQQFYDDPTTLRRGRGMKLLPPVAGPNEIGLIGEQSAIASVIASMKDMEDIQRQIQLATGESNLSSAANNDPHQARTATGARILAYNQDVLSGQLNNAFTYTSLREDEEIMYLLNRSELREPVTFDAGPYNREYGVQATEGQEPGAQQQETVTPLDFQEDGDEVFPEVGSTLADDDEAKVERATMLFERSLQSPHLINPDKARDEFLIAMGKGRELGEWVPPPAPQEPPVETPRVSLALKFEDLPTAAQVHILLKAGLLPASMQAEEETGPDGQPLEGAGGAPPQMGPPPPPMMQPQAPRQGMPSDLEGMPALRAAIGGGNG